MPLEIIDSAALSELTLMYKSVCSMVRALAEENKKLKTKKLLSAQEVAEMTGFHEKTIRLKKDEIGYFTVGKDVMFRPEDLDKWIEKNHVKPRRK